MSVLSEENIQEDSVRGGSPDTDESAILDEVKGHDNSHIGRPLCDPDAIAIAVVAMLSYASNMLTDTTRSRFRCLP